MSQNRKYCSLFIAVALHAGTVYGQDNHKAEAATLESENTENANIVSLAQQSNSANESLDSAPVPYSERITVTGTRHQNSLFDTDGSVGFLSEDDIASINPKHAADALNRIPGVYIAQLGSTGEGAAAAIRQPITYGPSYLYLENGVPVRSAGFFNHNALYEMNVPQATGVEVLKGPGTALYGSDAIGGVINVMVGKTPRDNKQQFQLQTSNRERNAFTYAGAATENVGDFTWRVSGVDDAGWREHTETQRQSLVLSYESDINDQWSQLSWLSYNALDLNTGGSGLNYDDFKANPFQAGNRIGFRDVFSLRFATRLTHQAEDSEWTIIPFVRSNTLEYMATWTLNTGREAFIPWLNRNVLDSQDAHINDSGHDSVGLITHYRSDLSDDRGYWIVGLDAEFSKGYQTQTYIVRTDNDAGDYWLSYDRQQALYDYRVDYTAYSPFVHLEWQLAPRWRLNTGLRFDYGKYDYDNRLSDVFDSRTHNRPSDQSVSLDHTSPKIGLVFDVSRHHNLYATYRDAFRIPGAYQLFRAGRTTNSTALKPVKANNSEIGLRGDLGANINYEIAAYRLRIKDDILSYSDPVSGTRFNTNAGETRHEGIELGLQWHVSAELSTQLAYTRANHEYIDWQVSDEDDFSGNEMPNAPKDTLVVVLDYMPGWLQGGALSLEWQKLGKAFIDEANTLSTDGHDLVHLRANYWYNDEVEFFTQVLNLADEHYAETTSKWGPKFTPGRPRSAFFGVKWQFL